MAIPKFISQFFSRKMDPQAEKQKMKDRTLEGILNYIQRRTSVKEVGGFYDSADIEQLTIRK